MMKTVLITGVSRGLGHAIATAFAAREFETIGIARSPCEIAGVRTVQLDVTDEPAVISFVESLENLDVVVNNAGIARSQSLLETSTDELREILEVNLVGAFVMMREAARRMTAGDGGLIINIASDAAIKGTSREWDPTWPANTPCSVWVVRSATNCARAACASVPTALDRSTRRFSAPEKATLRR